MPPTERKGRVHTSTVTVAAFERGPQREAEGIPRSDADFRIEWFRGSGAGGQHRNKHANSARVIHLPTGLTQERQGRKREKNLEEAMAAIRAELDALDAARAAAAENRQRAGQIGSGMRGDKRRTYRFQDDRVVDHVSGRDASCSRVMKGQFDLLWEDTR